MISIPDISNWFRDLATGLPHTLVRVGLREGASEQMGTGRELWFLRYYSQCRPRGGIGGQMPTSRVRVNDVLGPHV